MSHTRRQLLVRGAGLAASAGVPSLLLAAPALADESSALADLVALEQASALMYATIGESEALSPKAKAAIDAFHGHEQEHVTAFSEALDQLGDDAPEAPKRVVDSDHLAGLGKAKSERELLDFAIGLEEELVGAYLDASPELETGDVIRSGAEVGANHAQHLAVLRTLRGDLVVAAIVLPERGAKNGAGSSAGGTGTGAADAGGSGGGSAASSK